MTMWLSRYETYDYQDRKCMLKLKLGLPYGS